MAHRVCANFELPFVAMLINWIRFGRILFYCRKKAQKRNFICAEKFFRKMWEEEVERIAFFQSGIFDSVCKYCACGNGTSFRAKFAGTGKAWFIEVTVNEVKSEVKSEIESEMNIDYDALIRALSKKTDADIVRADCLSTRLHGGTLGDVRLLAGIAVTGSGNEIPYEMVLKIQKKWERYNVPDSWRREHDLYQSDFGTLFSENFRWPECYHAEMNEAEDETSLWLQYIDGISGLKLTGAMYERAAYELGCFQGRLYAEKPIFLQKLKNLSPLDYVQKFYHHYRSWPVVYDYIRAAECDIPSHLCKLLIHFDDHSDELFKQIEALPVIFCHRDFWVANIIAKGEKIYVIDWDTAGWGYLGEDIASLIADEADVPHLAEHYHRCIPAYYRGFSNHAGMSPPPNHCILELIVFMFGYRLVEWYLNAASDEEKKIAS